MSDITFEEQEKEFYKKLGIALRNARRAAYKTQTDVANSINVTFQQIQKYEKGTNAIPLPKLIMFLEATDTDWDYFFRILHKLDKKIYINGGRK